MQANRIPLLAVRCDGHGVNDGIAMRVLYVFPGRPHLRPVGPGQIPHAPASQSPLSRGNRALSAGFALSERRVGVRV